MPTLLGSVPPAPTRSLAFRELFTLRTREEERELLQLLDSTTHGESSSCRGGGGGGGRGGDAGQQSLAARLEDLAATFGRGPQPLQAFLDMVTDCPAMDERLGLRWGWGGWVGGWGWVGGIGSILHCWLLAGPGRWVARWMV